MPDRFDRPANVRPRGTITLRQGDTYNMSTGTVRRAATNPNSGTVSLDTVKLTTLDDLRNVFRLGFAAQK